jgi:hypothetical protein
VQWVELPFLELINVFPGFWMCLLCGRACKPGSGRHWSATAADEVMTAGMEHLRTRHYLRRASREPVGG